MNDIELLKAKLKLYSEVLASSADVNRKSIMLEMQKLALKLRELS